MTWVTWRQHRLEGLWVLVAVAVLGCATAFITHQLIVAGCPAVQNQGTGSSYCLNDDIGGLFAQWIVRLDLVQYGLVVFPALVGAFVGAPLVAREIENGTHRLAWTQGVTRRRWLLTKLALVFVPLLACAAVIGTLEVLLINAQGAHPNHWGLFDQQAPVTVGATAFALALGVATGSVTGKSIPAMAATLLGFVVTRVGIAELARAHYASPVLFSTHDPAFASGAAADPTGWWLGRPEYHDAAGHVLTDGQFGALVAQAGPGNPVAYLRDHGISIVQYYQPGDRFWVFQSVEAAILVGLALLILGFATYRVTRRVS